MQLSEITPLILTYNEAPNLDRTLQKLTWATQIIIIDSFSTDSTLEIAATYPQSKLYQRSFDTHAQQWNYGLEQVHTPWVLSLDADYVLSDSFMTELEHLAPEGQTSGYFAHFQYCVFSKSLRGTILPPRLVLFRKDKGKYIDDGHTQLLQLQGQPHTLKSCIYHDDRKSLSRWLWAQDRYLILEAQKLSQTPFQELSLGDKLRKLKLPAPFIVFFYCLILKGGILDGWRGWYYACQRLLAELLLVLRLLELEHRSE